MVLDQWFAQDWAFARLDKVQHPLGRGEGFFIHPRSLFSHGSSPVWLQSMQ